MYKIGAIGAGHMGMVVLDAMAAQGAAGFLVYDVNAERREAAEAHGFSIAENENEVYENCQMLLLAVRPQNCDDLFAKFTKPANKPVIVSIMAGISSNYIRKYFGPEAAVVTMMPTMGMKVNHGITAIAHTDNVPEDALLYLKKVFDAYGESIMVNESELAEIEGVSGCMPGYVYYIIDAFARSAQARGMEYQLAVKMAVRGFLGAAAQVLQSGNPKELLLEVCTPGGLTAQGVKSFDENKLDEILAEGMAASIRRRYEIGR